MLSALGQKALSWTSSAIVSFMPTNGVQAKQPEINNYRANKIAETKRIPSLPEGLYCPDGPSWQIPLTESLTLNLRYATDADKGKEGCQNVGNESVPAVNAQAYFRVLQSAVNRAYQRTLDALKSPKQPEVNGDPSSERFLRSWEEYQNLSSCRDQNAYALRLAQESTGRINFGNNQSVKVSVTSILQNCSTNNN